MLGGKWEKVKRCFSFSFHWPLSIGTFHKPPSNGTFQGPPSIRTFHWPSSWDLLSHFSFSFSLEGEFKSFGAFFSGHNFRFESWKYLFLQPSLGGEEWLVLIDGGKKDNRLDDCSIFERMEMSKDSVGSLKSYKNFTNPFGFSSTTSY